MKPNTSSSFALPLAGAPRMRTRCPTLAQPLGQSASVRTPLGARSSAKIRKSSRSRPPFAANGVPGAACSRLATLTRCFAPASSKVTSLACTRSRSAIACAVVMATAPASPGAATKNALPPALGSVPATKCGRATAGSTARARGADESPAASTNATRRSIRAVIATPPASAASLSRRQSRPSGVRSSSRRPHPLPAILVAGCGVRGLRSLRKGRRPAIRETARITCAGGKPCRSGDLHSPPCSPACSRAGGLTLRPPAAPRTRSASARW